MVEEVMKQYFEGGKHPGDKLMLAEAAAAAGLNQEAAAAFLETDEGAIEVNLEAARVRPPLKLECADGSHLVRRPNPVRACVSMCQLLLSNTDARTHARTRALATPVAAGSQ